MPNLGDRINGNEIGKCNNIFVWTGCSKCQKQYWRELNWMNHLKRIGKEYVCPLCAHINIHKYTYKGTIENPEIGDIRSAIELGKGRGKGYYIWAGCSDCGKPRWTVYEKKQASRKRCKNCMGAYLKNKYSKGKAPTWKSGRIIDKNNYIELRLYSDDFYFTMCSKSGYVKEHRLVMAKHLGRCLQTWELVHHKNGNKQDNKIENLELKTRQGHITDHCKGYKDGYTNGYLDGKSKHLTELQQHVKSLQAEINTLKRG